MLELPFIGVYSWKRSHLNAELCFIYFFLLTAGPLKRAIVVNQGQQTELPCETQSPTFNSTQHALRVEWFHHGGQRRPYDAEDTSSSAGATAPTQPIYTVDFGSPKEAGRTVTNARANLLQVNVSKAGSVENNGKSKLLECCACHTKDY